MNSSATPAKDFLSILDLSSCDLIRLVDLAAQMKTERHLADQAPTANALRGCHVAMLFEKPSLRTRSTFEIAVRELGGHTLQLPEQFTADGREPLEDVARNLERWVKALVQEPSAQDSRVAAEARSAKAEAQAELREQNRELASATADDTGFAQAGEHGRAAGAYESAENLIFAVTEYALSVAA